MDPAGHGVKKTAFCSSIPGAAAFDVSWSQALHAGEIFCLFWTFPSHLSANAYIQTLEWKCLGINWPIFQENQWFWCTKARCIKLNGCSWSWIAGGKRWNFGGGPVWEKVFCSSSAVGEGSSVGGRVGAGGQAGATASSHTGLSTATGHLSSHGRWWSPASTLSSGHCSFFPRLSLTYWPPVFFPTIGPVPEMPICEPKCISPLKGHLMDIFTPTWNSLALSKCIYTALFCSLGRIWKGGVIRQRGSGWGRWPRA